MLSGIIAVAGSGALGAGPLRIPVGCASAFAYLLTLYRVPDLLALSPTAISSEPIMILLVLGMIMDMAALMLTTYVPALSMTLPQLMN